MGELDMDCGSCARRDCRLPMGGPTAGAATIQSQQMLHFYDDMMLTLSGDGRLRESNRNQVSS